MLLPQLALEWTEMHLHHMSGNCKHPLERDVWVGLKHCGRKLSQNHSKIVALTSYDLLQI